MKRYWQDARARWEQFFFAEETPYGMALMRIVLPLVMMTMMLPRWPHVRELYSLDGVTGPLSLGYGFGRIFPEFSGPITVAIYSFMIFAMVCVVIGWQTRISLVATAVLYTYFCNLDSVSTMTKYSVITSHLLLLLAVSDCGMIWSVDAWLKGTAGSLPPTGPCWPRRLTQLLIGFVYFGAAITKMNTPTFLSGDQMQLWMLTHINFRHPIGEWMSLYPILLKVAAYSTLVWEVTFIFLVWRGMWRPLVLTVGVFFHTMTVLTLGLLIFPMVCFSAYLSFVDEQDWVAIQKTLMGSRVGPLWTRLAVWRDALLARIQPLLGQSRQSLKAGAAFVIAACASTLGAVEIEHRMDVYCDRSPSGKLPLKPISAEFAKRLLAPTEAIRDKDKFFAIDTGTILVGDLLADRRRNFRYGEKLIAQCHLVPPHEDMWIECKILDDRHRLVDRQGNVAQREAFRVNFVYPIATSMSPGEYTLVFETGGREVLRKQIVVEGSQSGGPAVLAAQELTGRALSGE